MLTNSAEYKQFMRYFINISMIRNSAHTRDVTAIKTFTHVNE